MEKFITGLRYGTWQTRLYVLAIPIALAAGIGVIITAFITNIIALFLVGVVFLIGGVALIMNYNIDESYKKDSGDVKKAPSDQAKAPKKSRKHGDIIVNSDLAQAQSIEAQKPQSEKAATKPESSETAETPGKAQEAETPEMTEKAEKTKKSKKAKKNKKDKSQDETGKESDEDEEKQRRGFLWFLKLLKKDAKEADSEQSEEKPKNEKHKKEKVKKEKIKKEKEDSPSGTEPLSENNSQDKNPPVPKKEDTANQNDPESSKEENADKEKKELPEGEHDEDELMDYTEVVMKKVFYKYKVKRDHKTIMIDTWDEKHVKQSPAYIWTTKGQVHILTIGQSVNQYTIPMSKVGTLHYKKGVICHAKEEYLQFRKESMISLVFSPYLPTYHEGNKNHRRVIYKNLFALDNGMTVTNTSAKAIIEMLNPRLQVDDIVTRDVRFNEYFKEIYKLGLLFREQIYTVKEYQAKVSEVLHNYVTSGVAQAEYENTLQLLFQHKLITEEYIMYYTQYFERIQNENIENAVKAGGRKQKGRKSKKR